MHESEEPVQQAYLSRTEVEMELARLALAVMRAAPGTFEDLGAKSRPGLDRDYPPTELATRLLQRTRPEHRPFVESRLLELARCLAGVQGQSHEWLDLTLELAGPGRVDAVAPSPHQPERRARR